MIHMFSSLDTNTLSDAAHAYCMEFKGYLLTYLLVYLFNCRIPYGVDISNHAKFAVPFHKLNSVINNKHTNEN